VKIQDEGFDLSALSTPQLRRLVAVSEEDVIDRERIVHAAGH
jgi:hypothetical protein